MKRPFEKQGLWAACALSAVLATPTSTQAHNGFGIAPTDFTPTGLIVTDGEEPLVLRWGAREAHLDQFYRLNVQAGDFPPTPSPPSTMRDGQTLVTLPADALAYEVPLDLSELASGVWRVHAEFDEPPFCVELEALPALVVLQRPGDPPPYGVMVTEPLLDSPSVDLQTMLRFEGVSPTAPTLTIEAGEIHRDPDFPPNTLCVEFAWKPLFTIADGVVMVADADAGADRWRSDHAWDTSAVANGSYLMRVTAKLADGTTSVFWSRRWVNVEHPLVAEPQPEAGPEPTADAGVEAPSTPGDDGCQGGGGLGWLGLATLLFRRRRVAQTAFKRASR